MDPGGKKPKNEKDKKIKNLFYCKILNNYLFSNYFCTESYSFLKMLLNRFYRLDLWIGLGSGSALQRVCGSETLNLSLQYMPELWRVR